MQKIFWLPWFNGDKKSSLAIRVDAFNAFNELNLGVITADKVEVNFGKVTTPGLARAFQPGAFRFVALLKTWPALQAGLAVFFCACGWKERGELLPISCECKRLTR